MNRILSLAPIAGSLFPLVLVAQSSPPASVTGYVTASYTASSKHIADTIVGRAYDRRHNEFMTNVGNLTVDRPVATDKKSAGVHFEAWLGQDAAVVKSNGLNLGPDADIWQSYVTLNLPLSGSGRYLQFKGGKFATLMGVEVGEDVLNPNLGVGYQDIFLEPFTDTGFELDAKLSSYWDAELRVVNGWDQVTDVNLSKTVVGRLGLTPDANTLVALTGYVGPEQPQNNVNQRAGIDLVTSRQLDSAAKVYLQLDYGQEADAASDGDDASWIGAGIWLTYDIVSAATLALRGDYMNDRNGARTSGVLGFPVNTGLKVGSITATLNVKRWEHALVRPEIRFDHASLPVFDTHDSQFSLGIGLSYIY